MSFSASEANLPFRAAGIHPAQAPALPDFAATYDEFFDFVWRNLRRLGVVESAVDDALQDVFVIVHRRWSELHSRHASFRSWLFGIVVRVAKDYRRTSTRKDPAGRTSEELLDPDTIASEKASPHENAELSEQLVALHEVLATLDESKRMLLILVELEQMTAPEIAGALDIPLNTVYSRLRAARQSFDAALARYREGQGDT